MKKRFFIAVLVFAAAILVSCSSAPAENVKESDTDASTEIHTEDTQEKTTENTTENTDDMYQPPRMIRITCVGDSITYGVGANNPTINSYPSQLKFMLGRNYAVLNFGKSSSYMINPKDYPLFKLASSRSVAYTSTNEYQNSLTSSPDIVFICLGANDAYVSNTNAAIDQETYFYESAVALAKKYQSLDSKPTVYFLSPPARYDQQYRLDYLKNTIIPLIRKAAEECGCEVIDIFSLTEEYALNKNTQYITSDGIHPADMGYKLIAEAVYNAVKVYRLPE